MIRFSFLFFFFNDPATTEIYTLSLHDALPISGRGNGVAQSTDRNRNLLSVRDNGFLIVAGKDQRARDHAESPDRKSTRLNSSHSQISYAVFCLKKKKKKRKNKIDDIFNSSIND